jgi:RHS repeat-associated protein
VALTDGRGFTTSWIFGPDSLDLYPETEKRPTTAGAVHVTAYEYDIALGVITRITQNPTESGTDEVTVRSYDGLGRLLCEALPGDACVGPQFDQATRRFQYFFGDPEDPDFEEQLSHVTVEERRCATEVCRSGTTTSEFSRARVYVDALGRTRATVRDRTVAGALSRVAEGHVRFDNGGRVAERYSTYLLASSPVPAWPTPAGLEESPGGTPPSTKFSYVLNAACDGAPAQTDIDPLGRPCEIRRPNGETTTYTYSGTRTVALGPDNLHTELTTNDRGQLFRKEEVSASPADPNEPSITTTFFYDGMGRLRRQRVNGFTMKTLTLDVYGRPVTVVDADSGTWTYAYDEAGNLIYADDPTTGQHAESCYDALNRLTQRLLVTGTDSYVTACGTPTGGTITPESTYAYDQQDTSATPKNFGLGELSSVTDLAGSEWFKYDRRGRVINQQRTISGGSATMSFTYDQAGQLWQIYYPGNAAAGREEVRHEYEADGLLRLVRSETYGVNYAGGAHYDVFGRLTQLDHGNGLRDTASFYSGTAENFRLQQLYVRKTGTNPPPAVVDLTFSYNDIGRLEQTVDGATSGQVSNGFTYAYDSVGRLKDEEWASEASTPASNRFAYNAFGNLSKKDKTLVYPLSGKVHQVESYGTATEGIEISSIDYDDSGRRTEKVTSQDAEKYTYNALGQMTRTDLGTSPTNYTDFVDYKYDYTGRRVYKQMTINGTAQALIRTYSGYAEDLGSSKRYRYYFFGGRLVAARESSAGFAQSAPGFDLGGGRLPAPVVFVLLAGVLVLLVAPGRGRVRVRTAVGPARALGVAVVFLAGTWPSRVAACSTPPPAPDSVTHYHLDRQGSVVAITDGTTGDVVRYIRYRAYGEVRGRYDAAGVLVDESQRFRHEFTAWETDIESSLQYAGARYFDAKLGQFLTHDPAAQFASPYALGPGDPINTADPSGAFSFSIGNVQIGISLGGISVSYRGGGIGISSSGIALWNGDVAVGIGGSGSYWSYKGLGLSSSAEGRKTLFYSARGAHVAVSGAGLSASYYGMSITGAVAGVSKIVSNSMAAAQGNEATQRAYLEAIVQIQKAVDNHPGQDVPLPSDALHAIMDWEAELVGDMSSIDEAEYSRELRGADGPFIQNWATINFAVSDPDGLTGTYSGGTINYYLQGFVTASAGRSVARMNAYIFGWNVRQFFLGEGLHNLGQIGPASAWARYGYDRYLQQRKSGDP